VKRPLQLWKKKKLGVFDVNAKQRGGGALTDPKSAYLELKQQVSRGDQLKKTGGDPQQELKRGVAPCCTLGARPEKRF